MTTANNNKYNNTTTSKKSVSSSTSYYTTNRSTTSSGRPYTRTSSFHSAMSGITTATEDFASCVEQESDIDSMESMNDDNTTNKFSIIMESIHDNDDNNDDDEDDDSHNSRSNNNNRRDVQKGKGNYNCNDKHICISEEEGRSHRKGNRWHTKNCRQNPHREENYDSNEHTNRDYC